MNTYSAEVEVTFNVNNGLDDNGSDTTYEVYTDILTPCEESASDMAYEMARTDNSDKDIANIQVISVTQVD